jgi:hypothetical protein
MPIYEYVDIPSYCHDCVHHVEGDEIMVGDKLGGGPEPTHDCLLNQNMFSFWVNRNPYVKPCQKFDDGLEN